MTPPTPLLDRLRWSHSATHGEFALEIWSTFASAVVGAIMVAGERLASPPVRRELTRRRGWWRRSKRPNRAGIEVRIPAEDSITDALVEQLEILRAGASPDDPLVRLNIAFASQQPRRRQGRIGPAALTTDIRAFVPDSRDLDMRIEAKVLFQAGEIQAEYLGRRGLLRFGDPRNPYSDTPVGAMLRFVVAPCTRPWADLVHGGLCATPEARAVGHVVIPPHPEPLSICDIASGHDGRPVTILHLEVRQDTDPGSWAGTGGPNNSPPATDGGT